MSDRATGQQDARTHETSIYEGKVDGLALCVAVRALELARADDARPDVGRVLDVREERDMHGRTVIGNMRIPEGLHRRAREGGERERADLDLWPPRESDQLLRPVQATARLPPCFPLPPPTSAPCVSSAFICWTWFYIALLLI